MKIAVTSTGPDLDSTVDPRFGRCSFFLIVDMGSMDYEGLANSASMSGGGAGIQAAQTIINRGAEVLLTGSVGPNAFRTLSAGGVRVVVGARGTVREAIEAYKRNELREVSNANVPGHFGAGRGMFGGRRR